MSNIRRFLCAGTGNIWVGIDVSNIVEIIDPQSAGHRISEVESGGRVMQYEEGFLPVIGMAEISSCRAPREDLPGGRIVVVKAGDDKIGFAVDLAEEIMMVKGDAVKAVKDAKSDLDAEILEGVTHDDDREIFILSVGRVCQLARVGHGGH